MSISSDLVLEQAAPTTQAQARPFGLTKSLERVSTKTLSLITSVVFLLLFFVLFLLTTLFITPTAPAYAQTTVLTPQQVVEYALTLEKLESDFYRRAVTQIESGSPTSLPAPAKAAVMSYTNSHFYSYTFDPSQPPLAKGRSRRRWGSHL